MRSRAFLMRSWALAMLSSCGHGRIRNCYSASMMASKVIKNCHAASMSSYEFL